jgi:hypothetical protein
MRVAFVLVLVAVVFTGCGGVLALDGDGGMQNVGGGNGGGSSAGGGTATGGGAALDGLPCDISALIATKCDSCHGTTLAAGAPWPIVSRAQLLEQSPTYPGQTKAQRSLIRIQAGTMPPTPGTGPTATELAAFNTWVTAGEPAGTCATGTGGGGGTSIQPTTCKSGSYFRGGEGPDMSPGRSCQGCHVTQKPSRDYFFMGTVFPNVHEANDCNATPPAGLQVQIIDKNGAVVITMTPYSTSGNFYFSNKAAVGSNGQAIAMPYTAKVISASGAVSQMLTPQTSGDCSSCHTEQGANGAPGRIVWAP